MLAWLAAASAAGAAVLMWLNVSGFSAALDETAARRMTAGAAATAATAIVLLGLAGAHYSFGRRGSRVGAGLLAIAVFGSLALPVAARGPGVAEARRIARDDDGRPSDAGVRPAYRHAAARRRVSRIHLAGRGRRTAPELRANPRDWGVDGSGDGPAHRSRSRVGARSPPGCIPPRTACGRHLSTTCAATRGRSPSCRITASRTCSCISGLLRREPNTSRSLRARPALEHPGRRRHHRRRRALAADLSGAAGPRFRGERPFPSTPGIVPGVRPECGVSVRCAAGRPQRVCRRRTNTRLAAVAGRPTPVRSSPEASAGLRDQFYSRAIRDLRAQWPVQLSAVRYQGLDTVGHYNLRYTRAAGRCRRQRRRTSPSPPGDRSLLRLHRQRDRRGHV